MAGKALLIGSDFGGLSGVKNDVAAMREALEPRGFEVRECLDLDATRDGIIAAYERLIDDIAADEAAVVFYSGHGGRVEAPSGRGEDTTDLMDIQFIVPTDYDKTTDEDFRGITSVELTDLHHRLAGKTDNVVVIFDCCHAGGSSRWPDIRLRVWPYPPSYECLRTHLDRPVGEVRDVGSQTARRRWHVGDNPGIVRIVACSPTQEAMEHVRTDGTWIGVLTEGLTAALAEAGTQRVNWWAVMDRVRRHAGMLHHWYAQRPEVHGPARRLLFQVAEDDLSASLPIAPVDYAGRVRLDGAPLLGVQRGDRFAVMPPGAARVDEAARLGDLTVLTVDPLWAEGVIEWSGTAPPDVPIGVRAFPTSVTAPEIAVRVTGRGPVADGIRDALGPAAMLRLAGPDARDWWAEVVVGDDGTVTVGDRRGRLASPTRAEPGEVAHVMAWLKSLAVGAALLRLADPPDDPGGGRVGAFGADVGIEWGVVVAGRRRPLSPGEPIHTLDRFYVRLENRHDVPIFVSIVDIGLNGKISVLNTRNPSGQRIAPGGSWGLGHNDFRNEWLGVSAGWPEGLPPDGMRPETVLLFVTSDAQDLRMLEQGSVGPNRGSLRTPGRAPLLDLAEHLARGDSLRELAPETVPMNQVRYDVHALRLDFEPLPRLGRFLAEDLVGTAGMAWPAADDPSRTLVVRLDEVAVHDNHTLFRDAGVRVDILVVTRRGSGFARQATTLRFGGIDEWGSTHLDGVRMFRGPVESLVDIAVWVTRDADGAADLRDLLAGELADDPADDPADPVAGEPPATGKAGWKKAEHLVLRAAEVLRRTGDGESVGLLRHMLPVGEGFSPARYPTAKRGTIQDFSITYAVEETAWSENDHQHEGTGESP